MTDENAKNTENNEIKDEVTIEVDDTLDDSVVAEESAQETIKKLREKLKLATKEKQEYLDGWQRTKADYLNSKKEEEARRKDFIKYAKEDIVSEMLPVLDSFTMAFANKEQWEKVDKNWRVGVEYIFSQLKGVLENNGLKEVNPIGETFDPARDEAIEYVEVKDQLGNNKIIEVLHKGYELYGKLIKAPKVKVGEFKQ